MCHINALIMRKNPKLKDINNIIAFMQSVTSISFFSNNDADGVYFSNTNEIIKSTNKLNYALFRAKIKNNKFILAHQRFSTSGFKEDSNQPLRNEDFILLHNGVLSSLGDKDKSDSVHILEIFINNFNEISNKNKDNKEISRTEIVKQSIQETFNNRNGSFSIMIFDIIAQKLYYFKNESTKINFFQSKNYLYITTYEDNKNFMHFLGENFNKFKIKDNKIYEISINNYVQIFRIGKIKNNIQHQYFNNRVNSCYTNDIKGNYNNIETETLDYSKGYDNNILYLNELKNCCICKFSTFNYSKLHHDYICYECYEKTLKDYSKDRGIYTI